MNIKKLETLSFQRLNSELKDDLNGADLDKDITSTSMNITPKPMKFNEFQ